MEGGSGYGKGKRTVDSGVGVVLLLINLILLTQEMAEKISWEMWKIEGWKYVPPKIAPILISVTNKGVEYRELKSTSAHSHIFFGALTQEECTGVLDNSRRIATF